MDDIKLPTPDVHAFDELNEAVNRFADTALKIFTKLNVDLTQAFNNMPPELYHQMGMKHPNEILRDYYLYEAEPDEVVDYILEQPKHTWKGVTIYPDEAWRYKCKSDWMWWRLT